MRSPIPLKKLALVALCSVAGVALAGIVFSVLDADILLASWGRRVKWSTRPPFWGITAIALFVWLWWRSSREKPMLDDTWFLLGSGGVLGLLTGITAHLALNLALGRSLEITARTWHLIPTAIIVTQLMSLSWLQGALATGLAGRLLVRLSESHGMRAASALRHRANWLPEWGTNVECLIEQIQADWPPNHLDLPGIASRHQVLPLSIDAGGLAGLKPDGRLVSIVWGPPSVARPIVQVRERDLALIEGARRYDFLKALLPSRAADSLPCGACSGTGVNPMTVATKAENIECWCGGLGWIPEDW